MFRVGAVDIRRWVPYLGSAMAQHLISDQQGACSPTRSSDRSAVAACPAVSPVAIGVVKATADLAMEAFST
jgi:hypothetical protein